VAAAAATGGTLVVCPPALIQQWKGEVERHSRLRVFIYEGVKWHREEEKRQAREMRAMADGGRGRGCGRGRPRGSKRAAEEEEEALADAAAAAAAGGGADDATKAGQNCAALAALAAADVVLTTYGVLQAEVHYSRDESFRGRLRRTKVYPVPESPLLQARARARPLPQPLRAALGSGMRAAPLTRPAPPAAAPPTRNNNKPNGRAGALVARVPG
jgi:hypothetical protein